MTSTLADNHIGDGRDFLLSDSQKMALLVLGNFSINIVLRIARRNEDRTHVFVLQVIQLKMLLHENGVLVASQFLTIVFVDVERLLADWLDEANFTNALL